MSIDNATKREWDEARKGVEWDQEMIDFACTYSV